jgi:VWFA-related protein
MNASKGTLMNPHPLLKACVLTIALAAASAAVLAQIRTRVELVIVPVTVRDTKGALVTRLTKDDFIVTEDGVRQTISDFDIEPRPLSVVFVVDDGMSGDKLKRLNPPGSESLFVTLTGSFTPEDEMASYRYDHFVEKLSDFTNDPLAIQKSFGVIAEIAKTRKEDPPDMLAEKSPKVLRSILNFLGSGSNGKGGRPDHNQIVVPTTPDPRVSPRPSSRVLHNAIYDAATVLKTRPDGNRKIIFVISDGVVRGDANVHTFVENANLLSQNQIQVFGISAAYGSFGALQPYAQATGGDVYPGTSSRTLEESFGRIAEQARYQYVLGYASTNKASRFGINRKINVTTKTPNTKVMHKQGYTQYPAQ